ncbi:hypothetical protein EJV46_03125 [Roseococcus sp. SYP-B2431]|uniref:hypothetical protein n=1 Tax=Roseococcus sp. SYP-B2431 TaxID=2496640 RepID=UPI0010D4A93B|nr:hypothetical protein [Roseococcus sp. SYP-B2431]TCH99682.1 hypothetical protein EJV46_03125 [Roseococcus sp. SYP-B2431]
MSEQIFHYETRSWTVLICIFIVSMWGISISILGVIQYISIYFVIFWLLASILFFCGGINWYIYRSPIITSPDSISKIVFGNVIRRILWTEVVTIEERCDYDPTQGRNIHSWKIVGVGLYNRNIAIDFDETIQNVANLLVIIERKLDKEKFRRIR